MKQERNIFWKLIGYTSFGKSIQNKLITWKLRAARREYKRYYLEIGKLGADFVVNCYPCGPDGMSRLLGYPLKKVSDER